MTGHVTSCGNKYVELTNLDESILKHVATPCLDDNHLQPEDFVAKGVLDHNASRVVLKFLYTARHGRPEIYCTVNTLA